METVSVSQLIEQEPMMNHRSVVRHMYMCHVPNSAFPTRPSHRDNLSEHVMYSLDISRVYYAVSSQVSALILLSLLSTTAVDNADEEGQLMKSLKADIANAHEHPRTVLTESFGIVCFNHGRLHRCCKEGRCGCYGRSWYAATVSANASTSVHAFDERIRANTHSLVRVLETRPRMRGRFGGYQLRP